MRKITAVLSFTLAVAITHPTAANTGWRQVSDMTEDERGFVHRIIEGAARKPAKHFLDNAARLQIRDGYVAVLWKHDADTSTIGIFATETKEYQNERIPKNTDNTLDTNSRFQSDSEKCDDYKKAWGEDRAIHSCIIYLWPEKDDNQIITRLSIVDDYMEKFLTLLESGKEKDTDVIGARGNRYLKTALPIISLLSPEQQVEFWEAYIRSIRALPNDEPSIDEKRTAVGQLINLFQNGATNHVSYVLGNLVKEIDDEAHQTLLKLRAFSVYGY